MESVTGEQTQLIDTAALQFFESLVGFTGLDLHEPASGYSSVLLDGGSVADARASLISARYREFVRQTTLRLYGEQGRVTQVVDDTDLLCSCLTNCRTLEQVLNVSASFDVSKTLPQRTPLRLQHDGERVLLLLSTQALGSALTPPAVALELLAILFQYKLLSWLAGMRVPMLDATLRFERSPDHALTDALEGIIRCRLRLGADGNTLVFPREVLSLPVVRSYRELIDVLRSSQIALLPLPDDRDCSRSVATLLQKALHEGSRPPSFDRVAAHLGYSNSTLRRHLAREGTSFRELLDACRREHAVALLGRSLTMEQIASQLGFSSASSFSCAFRTWTGEWPSTYRQQLQASSDSVAGQ